MNAFIKKSNCYGQQSLSQEAMDTYAQAVNVDPENVDIYFHRGQVNHSDYFLINKESEF